MNTLNATPLRVSGFSTSTRFQTARKRRNATHESSTASAVAPRFLSLRSSSPHSSRCARQGDELQLLVLPSLRRHLGLLRVRNGVDPEIGRASCRERVCQYV